MPPSEPHQYSPLRQQSYFGDVISLNTLLGLFRLHLQTLMRSWWAPELSRRLGDSDVVQEFLIQAEALKAIVLPVEVPAPAVVPAEVLEGDKYAVLLAAALEPLNQRWRDVVQLRLLDGLEFPKVAQCLGRSPYSLRDLFFRTVGQLRLLLETKP